MIGADAAAIASELERRFTRSSASWDAAQQVPEEVIGWVADRGLLGAQLPAAYGGSDLGPEDLSTLFEALGAVSGSLGSIVNVQQMVTTALRTGATEAQQAAWLPDLARGSRIAAFCLTEVEAGSDLRAIRATVERDGDRLRLHAAKRWITTGARADVFLVFANEGTRGAAVLVPRDTPGVTIEPIHDLLGLRSAHLAALTFDCSLPADAMVGRPGLGLALVASAGLQQGRMNVARMACGAMRATLVALSRWVLDRSTFGAPLIERGQVQQALTRLGVDLAAAKELTRRAGALAAAQDPSAADAALTAKYFATRAHSEHASTAVRLHGALGCHEPNALARYLRDAAVFEVVEGATEVIERVLGPSFAREFAHDDR